jgi:hypothetical protein
VRQYAAAEAIATSTGQDDSGLFELSFRDVVFIPYRATMAGSAKPRAVSTPVTRH